MQSKLFLAAAGLGLLSFVARPAIGATISTTIGSQHFTDAQVVGSAVFAAALPAAGSIRCHHRKRHYRPEFFRRVDIPLHAGRW
jgi:hypothetical protein